jgi:hypothetical protein
LGRTTLKADIFSLRVYFSYGQFQVYDQNVRLPGCAWTEAHSSQGFARRESAVNFGTPLEFGHADIVISHGDYWSRAGCTRAIAVPFLVTSGRVIVCGPEELNDQKRSFELPAGNYRLIAAQRIMGDEEEAIDLCFEPLTAPLDRGTILSADGALNPPTPLLEKADVAGAC